MVRSPFLILMVILLLFSCKSDLKENPISNSSRTKANSFRARAIADFQDGKFHDAYLYFSKAKDLYIVDKDTANVGYCLYQMAIARQTFGDYTGSEETLIELSKYNIAAFQAPIYNQLAIVAKELKNYDDAINYNSLTLKSTKNEIERISPLNNIAVVYILKGETSKAIPILESILRSNVFKDSTLQAKEARVVDNLGYAYFKLNRKNEALHFLNYGLDLRSKASLDYDAIESYLHLAEFYSNDNVSKSNEYALKGYSSATKHKSIDERLEALSFLMAHNNRLGKNQYATTFLEINDSITKIRNNAKNQFAKIRYDSQKEKAENQKLKFEKTENLLELERAKTQSLLFVMIAAVLALSIILIVKSFKKKNKREREKAIYDTETRISKQLHDELANDVFQVMSFAKTQDLQSPQQKETFLSNLDNIYSRTRDISRENSEIETGYNFETNLKQMIAGYDTDDIKVIIKDNRDIQWEKIQHENKVVVYRVLQELMVNMKKHSGANIVVVGFEEAGSNLQIKYSDNGVGVSSQLNLKNGLKNVENRIFSVNGKITFETESANGFRLSFLIPK